MSLRRSLLGELPPCTSRPCAVAQAANQPLGVGGTEPESSCSLCHPPEPLASACGKYVRFSYMQGPAAWTHDCPIDLKLPETPPSGIRAWSLSTARRVLQDMG